MTSPLPTVHVLYENPDWLPPLENALKEEGFGVKLHAVHHGVFDPSVAPEDGIWWNRMSPSSHTRGHTESVALMREILAWVERGGRRVINGSRAFAFEVSKFQQDIVLRQHGILTPRTVLAVGREHVLKAARTFTTPFLLKHNQGGKGLGIHMFNHPAELEAWLAAGEYDPDPNGQVVVQQYIQPRASFITRVEIVGGKMLLAMNSSTLGGFELCPSDVCQAEKKKPDVCPADGSATFMPSTIKADDPLVQQYVSLCAAEGIDLAGIEFIEDADGQRYTYDINANTNYNAALGRELGIDGMREAARWLKRSLSAV